MADEQNEKAGPSFSDADIAKAGKWFQKARECGGRREYDYGIECFITGLNFWPEAVEDGHMPLRALSIGRLQAGGKKAGMMEALKRSPNAKDSKQAMLNAEFLLAKNPTNASYIDALLRNASKAGFGETAKWVTSLAMESLRKDKKPNKGRFKVFRDILSEAAEQANQWGDPVLAAWFFEQAVSSLDYLIARNPTDMALKSEQRDLSGKLTIARGNYADADSFRESLQDAEAQKLLHDTDRVKQGDQALDALIVAAKKGLAAHPDVPAKINALVDVLLRRERDDEEHEAIEILTKAYVDSRNYSFKVRADEIRLRQTARRLRDLQLKAKETGATEDKQQARQAATEQLQTEFEVYRERCEKYPTDLRLKFRLGNALFKASRYDEAIPVLQAARSDPKNRTRCHFLIGRCFYERASYSQAREVLQEALTGYELTGDDLNKALVYWLARACEAEGKRDDAREYYGKLLRQDYNYADGDARKRHDALK